MQCIKTLTEWLKRIIAALTGTCIFGDAVTFINKDCRVLFGDIFIVPFLGPALGWTAMCSPGWGNLVAIDWNDLPMGREFDDKFLKNVKSPPHALPSPNPPPAGLILICALEIWRQSRCKKSSKKCIHIWVYVDVGAGTRVDDPSDHNNLITKMPDHVDNVGG